MTMSAIPNFSSVAKKVSSMNELIPGTNINNSNNTISSNGTNMNHSTLSANRTTTTSSASSSLTIQSPQPPPPQPSSRSHPHGQLATLISNNPRKYVVDGSPDGNICPSDMNRSTSAPPTEVIHGPVKPGQDETAEMLSTEDPRTNPEYAAFFYNHSRLDPRLPPPLYSPGQSWQLWSNTSSTSSWLLGAGNSSAQAMPPPGGPDGNVSEQEVISQQSEIASGNFPRKKLVDMIQEDFPRTPSPVYGAQIKQSKSSVKPPPSSASNSSSRHQYHSVDNSPRANGGVVDGELSLDSEDVVDRGMVSTFRHLALDDTAEYYPAASDDMKKSFTSQSPLKKPTLAAALTANSTSSSQPPSSNSSFPASYIPSNQYRNVSPNIGSIGSTTTGAFASPPDLMIHRPVGNSAIGGMMLNNAEGSLTGAYIDPYFNSSSNRSSNRSGLGLVHPATSMPSLMNHPVNPMMMTHASPFGSPPAIVYASNNTMTGMTTLGSAYQPHLSNGPLSHYHAMGPNQYGYSSSSQASSFGVVTHSQQQQPRSSFHSATLKKSRLPLSGRDQLSPPNMHPIPQSLGLDSIGVGQFSSPSSFTPTSQMAALSTMSGDVILSAAGPNPINTPTGPSSVPISREKFIPNTGTAEDSISRTRSSVLEDFRNNKNHRFEIKDIIDHIVEFSGDQYGSRFIQQKLEGSNPEDKQIIFHEILPHALELMTDVFGNYVIQKFFELGTPSQKSILAKRMEGNIVSLSLQMYGCRVVQKALEYLGVEYQESVIHELEGHVLRCVKDQNGNHVIQKCIERVSPRLVQLIINSFRGQVYGLATHPYGCRVIQRIFEHCADEQSRPLMEELHRYTASLVQDQYGNYVIQHILEKGTPEDKKSIINKIKGQVLNLSRHKFASNVVEKCVSYGTKPDRQALIEEIITTRSDGIVPLNVMVKDQFANYVIQKVLDVVDGEQRDLLVSKIKPQLATLRKFTYGKHIIVKVEKIVYPHGVPPSHAYGSSSLTSTSTGGRENSFNGQDYSGKSPSLSMENSDPLYTSDHGGSHPDLYANTTLSLKGGMDFSSSSPPSQFHESHPHYGIGHMIEFKQPPPLPLEDNI